MSTPATTVASAKRGRCRTTSRVRGIATPTSTGMPTHTRRGRRPQRPTALASGALSTHAGRPSTPRGGRTSSPLPPAPCCSSASLGFLWGALACGLPASRLMWDGKAVANVDSKVARLCSRDNAQQGPGSKVARLCSRDNAQQGPGCKCLCCCRLHGVCAVQAA